MIYKVLNEIYKLYECYKDIKHYENIKTLYPDVD